MTEALRNSLTRAERPDVASVADAGIAAALDTLTPTPRSETIACARAAGQAIANPDPVQLAVLGPRPTRAGPHQEVWDQAVATQAIYTHRYETDGRDMNSNPVPTTAPLLRSRLMRTITGRCSTPPLKPAAPPLLQSRSRTSWLNAANTNETGPPATTCIAGSNTTSSTPRHDVATAQRAIERTKQPHAPQDPRTGTSSTRTLTSHKNGYASPGPNSPAISKPGNPFGPSPTRRRRLDVAHQRRNPTTSPLPHRHHRPPTNQTGAAEWDKAAHLIERVRHNHGLTPNHGPQPGTTPLARAVGETNTQWQPLTRAVTQLTNSRP